MINTNQTIEQLEELKLHGMAQAYEGSLSLPSHDQPTSHELIAHLAHSEKQSRQGLRTQMYLKLSKLRYDAILENVQCSTSRNLTKEELITFADCSFVQRSENIIITGPTGSGKSYLACALGRQACSLGYKTLYLGINGFIERLTLSRIDGSFIKLLNQLEKIPLVIFDDFGLAALDANTKLALLQVLEDRYGRRSTIFTSQLPVSMWHKYLDEPTLADAIMDRLTGSAHRIELKGESLRRKK